MKHILSIFGIALAAFAFTACGDDEPNPTPPNTTTTPTPTPDTPDEEEDLSMYKPIKATVRDLALIYQGGAHRIDWTETQITPYVTRKLSGSKKEEWLFDGFLFLEFTTGGSPAYQFTSGYSGNNARKEHWEWYLDRLFEKNKSLDALNKVIERKKKTLGEPKTKHKVCLTCMVPISGQKDWGELDGVRLNFTKADDRLAAGEWFVDQLISRFEAGNYNNLELYGIYMICEEAGAITGFVQNIKKHIASKNLEFVWIPYYGATGAANWKGYGFDIAYQQPNHYFNVSVPDSRLDDAIQFAKRNKMAVEFECDETALYSDPSKKRDRMISYIDYFEKYGIWYDTPIAYYTGNHLFLDFTLNPEYHNIELLDRVCKQIINRRKAAEQ